jgi:nicotinamide-nucleotide amidase
MYRVELISTGAELLNGKTVNTHGALLGNFLREMGLRLDRDTTVGDEFDDIREIALAALERADIIFVSGGLGPTTDDITRDVFAEITDDRLVYDSDALERLRLFCERGGRAFTDLIKRQALVLSKAEVLASEVGAAPGELLRVGERMVFLLPGPPGELRHVLYERVRPILEAELKGFACRPERVFQVCLGESDIAGAVMPVTVSEPVDVAYCASERSVEVRLSSDDAAVLDRVAKAVRAALGRNIFAEGRTTMEAVVVGRLTRLGRTLAVAESCTGGLLASRITDVGGSSACFLGGVVCYANQVKTKVLGVDAGVIEAQGAVCEEVARQMAQGVRQRLGADYGVGITGIAGPGGGSGTKPVGLAYIAVADAEGGDVTRNVFGRDRLRNKKLFTQVALNMLRLRLPDD